MTLEQRRALIEPEFRELSIVRQCEVLDIHRSGFYYKPKPMYEEDLRIMRLYRGDRIPAHAGARRKVTLEVVGVKFDKPW